ncbi:zinc ABC transporter substrate-binding protein [Tranquillimonas rosea]|uniref:zinc ABC transporter substrate-binding protein n=1 Tax=Tranquillimonas rosea TaxID=641238 RepID=UPI003BAB054F
MKRLVLALGLSLGGVLPASAQAPTVVADIPPVHSLVATVMGDVGAPELLVQPGASPHGYSMRPSEARALQNADLVVWTGGTLTPWLASSIETLGSDAMIVELLETEGTTRLDFRDGPIFGHEHEHGGHNHEHDHEHDESAHHGEAHDDHAHEGVDPHAWLDPQNAIVWTRHIADALAEADPENAETYRNNAADAVADLQTLSDDIRTELSDVRAGGFVVFHDAYHYFEHRFGIPAAAALSVSDASDPSPARIDTIRDQVADLGVACVFAEPQFDPGLVESVFEGTVQTGVLDPLGIAYEPGASLYSDLLRGMARTIADCAG